MERYPSTIPQSFETQREAVDFARVDVTDDGTARVAFWATFKQSFMMTVKHRQITTAQKEELITFWAANKNLEIEYVWPATGKMYHANFTAAPSITPLPFGRWSMDVFMVSHDVVMDGEIYPQDATHAITSDSFVTITPPNNLLLWTVGQPSVASFMALDTSHSITTCCVAINAHLVKDNTHAVTSDNPTILERVPESVVHAHTAEKCRIQQGPP